MRPSSRSFPLLLVLFAVQHSLMARPFFKRWLCRRMPAAAERSTYVLLSSVTVALLMWYWQPLGGVVWSLVQYRGHVVITTLYLASWCLLVYSTFLIDHFELFGLRQAWRKNRDQTVERSFVTPSLYRLVRHPIYLSWLGIFWFTPIMTASHLVLACGMTLYILVGIQLEERDLVERHPEYRQYQVKVPALIPSLTRRLRRPAPLSAEREADAEQQV